MRCCGVEEIGLFIYVRVLEVRICIVASTFGTISATTVVKGEERGFFTCKVVKFRRMRHFSRMTQFL